MLSVMCLQTWRMKNLKMRMVIWLFVANLCNNCLFLMFILLKGKAYITNVSVGLFAPLKHFSLFGHSKIGVRGKIDKKRKML